MRHSHSRNPLPTVIVGAGMAGLACARELRRKGPVLVLDKGRAPGGRLSTRHSRSPRPSSLASLAADHGGQFFTVRDSAFRERVGAWRAAGAVDRWTPRLQRVDTSGALFPAPGPGPASERFVGTPTMAALVAHQVRELGQPAADGGERSSVEIRFGARVTALRRVEGDPGPSMGWRLDVEDGRDGDSSSILAARVLLTTPAEQARVLLEPVDGLAELAAPILDGLSAIETAPCWAVMAQLPGGARRPDFDALAFDPPRPGDAPSPLAWAADAGSKPGRDPRAGWTLHATVDWSRAHLDDPPGSVAPELWRAFGRVAALPEADALPYLRAHRWKYARIVRALGEPCLWQPELGLGYAGDGCLGPRVEAAFVSGRTLGLRVSGHGDH